MALQKRKLKDLGFRESFCPAPVGNKSSWKEQLHADKRDLACLKKKRRK